VDDRDPVTRRDLHASISQLEWTVNAYTLTFRRVLLTGAALGDRFGRRVCFALGLPSSRRLSLRGPLDLREHARPRAASKASAARSSRP